MCICWFFGRFNPDKDQKNFVMATGRLARINFNVRFMMVGRNLDVNNLDLMHWIKETDHVDRFILLGERSDVSACLSAMDIFCLHSRTEGFPNVLGEAMAIGLPCVATDVGDAALLLGGDGIIVQKENHVLLANGLKKLLALTGEERSLLGRNAKQRINDKFTLSRTREQFEVIYNEVLNGGGSWCVG